MMTPARIELRIEELVLHGIAAGDRYRIGAAVEAELARLLAEQSVPVGWGQSAAAARLDGGAFVVAPGARADVIGAQVARAVYGSLGGSVGSDAGERTGDHTGGSTNGARTGQPGGGGR